MAENVLANFYGAEVRLCEFKPDFSDKTKFVKLESDSAAKMQISAFVQDSIPAAMAGATSNLYTVTFPKGVPQVLTKLKDGRGYITPIKDAESGKFVAHAALNQVGNGYAIVAGAFSVMSIATSQYYLSEINNKLNKIQLGVDKILDFLYGEKRAELMSEVAFAKYAYENFASIMAHSEQREATIVGLQSTKKTAMKDLEFYICDLDNLADNVSKDIPGTARKALQLKNCLDISAQLYVLSGIMEMYYSQNTDRGYVSYLENEMSTYLKKSESHILQDYAKIVNPVVAFDGGKNPIAAIKGKENIDDEKKRIKEIMDELTDGEESKLRRSLKDALHAADKKSEFYINGNGDIYMSVGA